MAKPNIGDLIPIGAIGTAKAPQVLSGHTFSSDAGVGLAGSMPNRGALNRTLSTQGQSISIASGYYTGGSISANISNLSAGNIRSGVSVGGVVGNYKQSVTTGVTSRAAAISTASAGTNTTIRTGIQVDNVFVAVSDPTGRTGVSKLVSRGEVWNAYDSYYKVDITFNTNGSLVCYTYTNSMSGLDSYVSVNVAYGVAQ